VFHVQTAVDLQWDWISGARTVGLTAGTSTPDVVIDGVERWLLQHVQMDKSSEQAGTQADVQVQGGLRAA
jgi:4-hydroxy-3-methylbut-2-enyl diphosphate reductase IspH